MIQNRNLDQCKVMKSPKNRINEGKMKLISSNI